MPRAYSSGGRVARGSPARMPKGLPLPNTRTFKERVGALKNLWPFLKLPCIHRSAGANPPLSSPLSDGSSEADQSVVQFSVQVIHGKGLSGQSRTESLTA